MSCGMIGWPHHPQILTTKALLSLQFDGKETFICGSFQNVDFNLATEEWESGLFETPCLLNGLTCEDYKEPRCPQDEIFRLFCDTIRNRSDAGLSANCSAYPSTQVSVVSIQCPTFFMAFSDALVYITYVQIFLVLICLLCYRGCCARKEDGSRGLKLREMPLVAQDVILKGLEK
jgi:hypothetical protein